MHMFIQCIGAIGIIVVVIIYIESVPLLLPCCLQSCSPKCLLLLKIGIYSGNDYMMAV